MEKDKCLKNDNQSRNSHIKKAEVIQVIRTVSFYGNGTNENPNRFIYQYWDLNGTLLATVDKNTLNLEEESFNSIVKRFGKEIKCY